MGALSASPSPFWNASMITGALAALLGHERNKKTEGAQAPDGCEASPPALEILSQGCICLREINSSH